MGFWEALETHSLFQITVEWQRLLGSDYESARFLLKITGQEASAYPCPSPYGENCPREIIKFTDDDIEAVCCDPDTKCGSVKLTPADIMSYTVDLRKLAEHLAQAFGIGPAFQDAGYRRAWVGSLPLAPGQQVEVHLALPSSKDMVQQIVVDLILRNDPCLLLVPTRQQLPPDAVDRLNRAMFRVINLDDIATLTSDERIETTFDLRSLFDPVPNQATDENGTVKPPDSDVEPRFWSPLSSRAGARD